MYDLLEKEKRRKSAKIYYHTHKNNVDFWGNITENKEKVRLKSKLHWEKYKDDTLFREKQRLDQRNIYNKNKNDVEFREQRNLNKRNYVKRNKQNIMWINEQRIKNINYNNRQRLKSYAILGGFRCNNPNCIHPTGDIHQSLFEIDHINSGGYQERKNGLGTNIKYLWINKNPEEAKKKYQVLCNACNRIKIEEMNENKSLNKTPSAIKIINQKVKLALGGKCSDPNCVFEGGCGDMRILDIHHINCGGHKEAMEIGSYNIAKNILKNLEKAKSKYVLLCIYCHGLAHIKIEEDIKNNKKIIIDFILNIFDDLLQKNVNGKSF